MPVIVHIFTVLFAILCFMIIKKKRYKKVPVICFIMFVSFISFGTASLIALFAPYGEILSYPCMIIALGLLLFLVGVNDLYSIFRCTERIEEFTAVIIHIMAVMVFILMRRFLSIHTMEYYTMNRQRKQYPTGALQKYDRRKQIFHIYQSKMSQCLYSFQKTEGERSDMPYDWSGIYGSRGSNPICVIPRTF